VGACVGACVGAWVGPSLGAVVGAVVGRVEGACGPRREAVSRGDDGEDDDDDDGDDDDDDDGGGGRLRCMSAERLGRRTKWLGRKVADDDKWREYDVCL
jgi:hypothetical protein